MEYCRRSAITEFSFKREFRDHSRNVDELVYDVCEPIKELEGGEFFVVATPHYVNGPLSLYKIDYISITFYFYNIDDMILAKLSI